MPLHPQQAVSQVRRFFRRLRQPTGLEIVLLVVVVAIAALLWRGRRARKRAEREHGGALPKPEVRDIIQPTVKRSYAERQVVERPSGDAHMLAHGESFKVAGRAIQGPFLWVAGGKEGVREPAALVTGLEATPGETESLGYWPSYSSMEPAQRAAHLDWLAAGRPLDQSELGYVFTYFYGLESAAVKGLDAAATRLMVKEVLRLRAGYAHSSRSFERYSRSLLLLLLAREPNALRLDQIADFLATSGKLDEEQLNVVLHGAACHAEGKLRGEAALLVARWLPEAKRSVVVERAGDEFERLFRMRFDEAWPDGLALRQSKRASRFAWYPASSVVEGETLEDLPSYLGMKSQFRGVVEVWNRCIAELSAFSRVLGKTDGDRDHAAAYEALPAELRETVDHPQADAVRQLLQPHLREGAAIVPASELAKLHGLAQRDKLTLVQSRKLAAWAEAVGWSLVPDVRHGGRGYRWDAPVAAFVPQHSDPIRAEHYAPATLTMRAAWQIAHADGAVDLHEIDVIREHLATAMELNAAEQERLLMLERVLVEQKEPERGLLKRLREALSLPGREAVARLLVAVAASDEEVSAAERKALAKAFGQLDVDLALLDELLPQTAVDAEENTPEVEAAEREGRSEEPAEEPTLQLDRARIDAILADTADVQRVLADAMAVEEEEAEQEAEEEAQQVEASESVAPNEFEESAADEGKSDSAARPNFPPKLEAFGEHVLTQSEWQREELDAWAREQGQMLSGLIEMLNDWSMEHFDDWLLEESGDRIHVLPETLELVA